MDNIFNKISISLIVLGIAFYAFAMTFTALIPSILGLLMQVVLFLGRTLPKFHKHFAHNNVLILRYCGKSLNLYSDAHGKNSDESLNTLTLFFLFHFSILIRSAEFCSPNSPA